MEGRRHDPKPVVAMFAMAESAAKRESNNGAQGNEEEEEDDYMADLSRFLPSEALDPPKSSSKTVTCSLPFLPLSFVILFLVGCLKKFDEHKASNRYTYPPTTRAFE